MQSSLTAFNPLYRAIVLFVVGFITGYIAASFLLAVDDSTTRRAIMYIISFVWLLTMLASIVTPSYETPLPVHGVMGMVVGYLFARDTGLTTSFGRGISIKYEPGDPDDAEPPRKREND